MTNIVLVLTTVGSEQEAREIANELVKRRLAACVNVVPRIQSVYRWAGKVESAEELLLIIKTTKGRSVDVKAAIRELHSYDLPECVVFSMEDGSVDYLKWIEESVG